VIQTAAVRASICPTAGCLEWISWDREKGVPEPSLSFGVAYRKDNAVLQGPVLDSLRGCLRDLRLSIPGKAEL
jgi:hypothetical protein